MRASFPILRRPTSARKLIFLLSGGVVFLFTQSGCSVSKSISDSISSPFEWSSDSSHSSSKDREDAYRNDIRDYTDIYVRSNKDPAGLRGGIAAIADKHGVTNWEADSATYEGIGAGLAKAKLSKDQVAQYASVLAEGDKQKSALEKGYKSAL